MLTAEQVEILLAAFRAHDAEAAAALLERLSDEANPLTDDELVTLEEALVALGEVDELGLPELNAAVAAVAVIRDEAAARIEAAETEAAERERLRAELAGEGGDGEGDGEGEGDGAGDGEGDGEGAGSGDGEGEGGEGDGAGDGAGDGQGDREPVTAGVRPTRPASGHDLARLRSARQRPPAQDDGGGSAREVTAHVNGPSGELTDLTSVTAALLAAHNRTRSVSGGVVEQVQVVSIDYDYPEDRVLADNESDNERRISSLAAALQGPQRDEYDSLVAAGGLCAPLEPRYDIPVFGTDARPVADGLQRFQARRGGITWRQPPTIGDFGTAVSQWTLAMDADTDPNRALKPCMDVPCGGLLQAVIYAVTECITYENISAMTDPETVNNTTQNTANAFARKAETLLLDQVKAGSRKVKGGRVLGAARDLIGHWDRVAIALRSNLRLPPDSVVELMTPWWVENMIREDIMRSLPHGIDQFSVADALIDRWLADRNIVNTIEYLDSPTTGTSQVWGELQQGGVSAPAVNIEDYPDDVQWAMYPPGTWLFLDRGQLDLGIFRDQDLIRNNKYASFMETFEGAAMVGVRSYWGTSTVCPNGATVGTVAPGDLCAGPYVP